MSTMVYPKRFYILLWHAWRWSFEDDILSMRISRWKMPHVRHTYWRAFWSTPQHSRWWLQFREYIGCHPVIYNSLWRYLLSNIIDTTVTYIIMATSAEKTVIAFDLYGTILSTASIAKELSHQLHISDDKSNEVASLARRYQLEYTWRFTSMSKHSTSWNLILHARCWRCFKRNISHSQISRSTQFTMHCSSCPFSHLLPSQISRISTLPYWRLTTRSASSQMQN